MNQGTSNVVAGLYEAFSQQQLICRGGYRGPISEIAIRIPGVRANPRDRQVMVRGGEERTVPYWVLNQSREIADSWISQNLGAENLISVQQQLG